MPVYEFFCESCDDKFEILQPMTKMVAVMECPEGHVRAQRVPSMFATVSTVSSSQAFDESGCGAEAAGCGADNCCAM